MDKPTLGGALFASSTSDMPLAEEEEEQKEKTSGANSGVVSEDEGGVLTGMSEGVLNDAPEASSSMAAGDENKASSLEEAPLAVKPMPNRWADLEDDE